jgi:hypothetical protein
MLLFIIYGKRTRVFTDKKSSCRIRVRVSVIFFKTAPWTVLVKDKFDVTNLN